MNNEKFNYAGELNQELQEIEQMFIKDENVMDTTTITVGCMAAFTLVCC